MYLSIVNDIQLNESAFGQKHITSFEPVFKKMRVYARQQKFINEGRSHIPGDILFNIQERRQINEMLSCIEYQLLYTYLTESEFNEFIAKAKGINEGFFDKGKELLKKGSDLVSKSYNTVITELIKHVNLPAKVKNAIELIEKILKATLTKVSQFVKAIAGILEKLGNSIKEAVLSLKLFNDEKFINSAPQLGEPFSHLTEKDKTSNAVFNYVMAYVITKAKDGSYKEVLNESRHDNFEDDDTEDEYSDSWRNLDNWFLKHKDSWLEKSKNNIFFRLFLSGTNASGERLGFWKTLWISIIGSFIVCTLVPLIASGAFGLSGAGLTLLVIACKGLWLLKNVARIIINRTLTYKQTFTYKDNELKHSRLFDLRTILSLAIAILTPVLFSYFAEDINEWLHSLFPHDTPDPAPLIEETDPEIIEDQLPAIEPTPEPVVEPTPEPTPDPAPVIKDIINDNVKPITVNPGNVVKPEEIINDPAPIVQLPDPAPVPAEVTVETIKPAAEQLVNQTNIHVENYTNITNIDRPELGHCVNCYNSAAHLCGGHVGPGVVIMHDHGDHHGCMQAIVHHGGRVLSSHGGAHAVEFHDHGSVLQTRMGGHLAGRSMTIRHR